ncbi:hypothetical protein ES704_01461 [subsurface metagenome]|jgi:hypothetical protein
MERENQIRFIGGIYLICAIIFLIFGFFPYTSSVDVDYFKVFFGVEILLYGGWFGLIFIFISGVYLVLLDVKKALILGFIGIILIGINFGIIFWGYFYRISEISGTTHLLLAFYIGLITWLLMVILNFITVFFVKSERITTTVESKREQSVSPGFQKVYCSSCGAEILDVAGAFCSKCGAPLK